MQNSLPRAGNTWHSLERPLGRWLGAALAALYFGLCVLWTQPAPQSWNDIARVAAIESLGERGTWAIDDSPWFEQTMDKVRLNGKFYSDKMPVLTWVAAGVYNVLYRSGISLAPDCAPNGACAYYPLTLLFVGLPASLMMALMFEFARAQNRSVIVALIGTLALGLATMVLPYSLVLNHHLPAAVSLFAAFYLLTTRAKENVRWLLGVGLCAALAVTLDPLSGILAVALGVLTVVRFRVRAYYFALGALLPLLITAWLDVQIAGTMIPPYLIPSGYAYEGSAFPATVGGNGTPDDPAQYAFKMFLGAQGLYAYNPVLLFAVLGLGMVAVTRAHALQIEAIVIGLAFILLSFYLATRTGNLGGEAYGERWFVQAIPLLMAFLFFAPPRGNFQARSLGTWIAAPLFVLALGVSLFSTYQGARNPWRYVPPPAHPTRDAATGNMGWKWEVRSPFW